jgi:mannosyltransferase OCH1-like enzyme
MLWNDTYIESFPMKFLRHIYESEPTYQGKSDVARLEILYEKGGVYIDADSMIIDHSLFEDCISTLYRSPSPFLMTAWEHEDTQIANGVIACTPKHPIIKQTMQMIADTYADLRAYNPPWKVTGPVPFTKVVMRYINSAKAIMRGGDPSIMILPSNTFYPIHWEGIDPNTMPSDAKTLSNMYPDSCLMHWGYTTNNLTITE